MTQDVKTKENNYYHCKCDKVVKESEQIEHIKNCNAHNEQVACVFCKEVLTEDNYKHESFLIRFVAQRGKKVCDDCGYIIAMSRGIKYGDTRQQLSIGAVFDD